jgi:nucleoside 2-deoxyribosyltransferase
MNIFFTAAVKGGRQGQPEHEAIVQVLQQYGTVLSPHLASDELSEYGETGSTAHDIYTRELAALEQSNIVVAEVTTPSLGVGYFIARATAMGKKVIALYNREDSLRLSAIIQADPLVQVHSYEDQDDLVRIFEQAFK